MPRVAVAGSDNSFSFAVIDFTNPASPIITSVNPGFGGNCRVTLDGPRCFVGNGLGGEVRLVDVTNPAAPVQRGIVNTALSGIGALAVQGSLVAVGEWVNNFQARVALLDFSNPAAPAVLKVVPTPLTSLPTPSGQPNPNPPAITSIAFTGTNHVVAAGSSDPEIVKIDFSNLANPVVTTFLSGFSAVAMDADLTHVVAGDQTGAQVKLFDAATNAVLAGPAGTTLGGVTSLALAFPLALAGSANDLRAVRVAFSGTSATMTAFTPSAGGGFTTAVEGTLGACGTISGFNVVLVDLAPATPAVLGVANSGLGSIGTLSLKTFTVPAGPALSITPASLSFGTVRVGTASTPLPLGFQNTGGGILSVLNLAAPNRFQLNSTAPLSLGPGATASRNVTFSPSAETPFSGNITMSSNDPSRPTTQVPVSGTGSLPHISVTPAGPLNLGNVAVCQSTQTGVTIANTGGVQLTVTSVSVTGADYSASPASLVVAPGGTQTVTLRFTPTVAGPANGTLTIQSDDPASPTLTRALTATGLTTPPPLITVNPDPLDIGAVPINFFAGRRLSVSNTGPCQDLVVTLTSAGPPLFVTIGDPVSVPPAATPVSATIPPGQVARFAVIFAPATVGQANGIVSVTSNAANAPNIQVSVSGTGVNLSPASIELVLDRSGSMSGAAPGGTKMDALKAAGHLFADLLPTGQGEEMGSIEFDDAVTVLTPFASYDTAQRSAIESGIDSLSPRNFTSIGGGMQLGQGQLAGASGRKVMVVFTDGLENTPPTIASVRPQVIAAGIESYAVGLGQPQNISAAALSQLAVTSGGKFFQTDDTLILRKDFVEVLADAFRQNMAADPVVVLPSGQQAEIPVLITDCERRVSFVANWDNPSSAIDLEVVSPGGTVYTAASPSVNQLVRFGARPGYRFLQVAFPPLDPGSGLAIGPQRTGTWVMRLKAVSLTAATERCTTSVFVDSDLTMRIGVEAPEASAPVQVKALLGLNGVAVTNAQVRLTLVRPARSLAQVQTPAVIARALNADRSPIAAGGKPLIGSKTTKHVLKPHGEGGYVLELPAPLVDGVYQFTVEAMGDACGGVFQRYSSRSLYIGRKVDPEHTTVEVTPIGVRAASVTVIPRDVSGAPAGAGMALGATVRGGAIISAKDNRDGSFSFRVAWKSRVRKPLLRMSGEGWKIDVDLTTSPGETRDVQQQV
jgi:von Willebrand factor type A domain/Abnormal spindle-like microcephaly-assoc'd, ASPM-SPD-2-Hydin